MTIQIRGTVQTVASGASPRTVTAPAGIQEGDLLLIFVGIGNSSTPASSGFTGAASIAGTGTSDPGAFVLQKIATSSEPGTYDVTWAGVGSATVGIIALYDDNGTDLVTFDAASTQQNTTGTELWASVNAATASDLLLCFGALAGNVSVTPDGSCTERWDVGSSPRIYLMTQQLAASGATGTRTATSSHTVSNNITVVVRSDPAIVPSSADFSATPTSGPASLDVDFTDLSTGDYDSWDWDFGDGSSHATTQNPSHTYTTPGTYTVVLTIDGDGGEDAETKTDYITVFTPVGADFSGDPLSGIAPLDVDFTDASTGDFDTWDWDFGDSGTSAVQNPSHTYTSGGTYTVALTTSGDGGTDTETKTDYITVYDPPTANFSGTPTTGQSPLEVAFTDTSTGDYDTWHWDFGDGNTSTLQNPTHTYVGEGVYTVTLTVSGPGGEDTETKTDYIGLFEELDSFDLLYILQPQAVFKARVNQASITYPISQVTFDTVTLGVYTDVAPDMTVSFGSAEGLRDLGQTRVRKDPTSTILYFGRSSQGDHDGEVNLSDDCYITVWDDFRVWAKIPVINADDETVLKDSDIEVGDNTTLMPPVANGGPGTVQRVGIFDAGIEVDFDATNSVAIAPGATITDYLWDVKDGTITVGTATDAQITATFDAGFRWVSLTATDTNGKTHTCQIPIAAVTPDDNTQFFQVKSHRISPQGQEISFELLTDLTFPDGTLVMWMHGDPTDPADRSHVKFIGWHQTDPNNLRGTLTGATKSTTITCVDVAGRLNLLPGFSQVIETVTAPSTWMEMKNANADRYIHYLLHWHTTALVVADYFPSGTGDAYPFTALGSEGASQFDQIEQRANAIMPDHHFTCNRLGQLQVPPDPMLQEFLDRTSTNQVTLTEDEYTNLQYTQVGYSRLHWLRGWAIQARSDEVVVLHCQAPGDAAGQGERADETNEHLAISQTQLNQVTGHRYARLQAPQSHFRITLADGDDRDIEPADLTWVSVNLSTDRLLNWRGQSFVIERGLVHEMRINYNYTKTGLSKTVELEWERETVGLPALTVTLEEVPEPDPGWWPEPPPPTPPDVPDEFSGVPQAYVMWDGVHVYYTPDILAGGGPTWEFADDDFVGNIYDVQYVVNSGTTVGLWLLASTGVWFCPDIFTSPRAWENKLPLSTVQAADATPTDGSVEFKCMANYASSPGYLCVATGPDSNDAENNTYEHAYFWYTSDYGDNWTQVDAGSITYSGGGATRGYCYSSLFAMEIFRSSPGTIYCLRSAPNVVLNYDLRVFISSDLGATWAIQDYIPQKGLNNRQLYSLIHPYPSATDPAYIVSGPQGVADQPDLHLTTDEWETGAQLTDNGTPSGYGGVSGLWRVNKISLETDHIIAWFRNSTTATWQLLESNDRGSTWSMLYDSGLATATIPNVPGGNTVSVCPFNTPNGWPPDSDVWFMIRGTGFPTAGKIYYTADRFATAPTDLEGNLNTLLSGNNWTPGPAGGIALPKIGPNA